MKLKKLVWRRVEPTHGPSYLRGKIDNLVFFVISKSMSLGGNYLLRSSIIPLPEEPTIPVTSEKDGIIRAEQIYKGFISKLMEVENDVVEPNA